MHTILLPFDGSESAMRAAEYLVDFSATLGDVTVHVVNVQTEPKLFGNYVSPTMLDQLNAGALDHAAEVNAKVADKLRAANLAVQTHEIMGEVVSELVDAARKLGCTMIVMGTRGMGSLGNLVLGSVASQVVHETPIPVLLVK
ncbi:universal stress protein [Halopseudomonas salina]|uniref:Universal stress protein n=1 Tax=Halopseudomonas salina TaxID=1323744 RepID=A0ABQ1P185_9GAMM|nr:universal stress protein [Halopseudomonas salina]GGC88898.1 universal stress protein [Halopseudomonas salina]